MTTDIQLTSEDFWAATAIAATADLLLIVLLLGFVRPFVFQNLEFSLTVASGLLWGGFACLLIWGFWDLYYRFIFPGWVRTAIPLCIVLYGAVGLLLWWLAGKTGGSAVLSFCLLGGLVGVLEHLAGIAWLGVLDKVPMLSGVPPLPVLAFAFFEYVFYWEVVLGVALLSGQTGIATRGKQPPLTKPG